MHLLVVMLLIECLELVVLFSVFFLEMDYLVFIRFFLIMFFLAFLLQGSADIASFSAMHSLEMNSIQC